MSKSLISLILLLIFCLPLAATAKAKSKKQKVVPTSTLKTLDALGKSNKWMVSHPAKNRVLLSHVKNKKFIFVMEHKTSLSVEKASEYILKTYAKEARKELAKTLNIPGSKVRGVEADTSEIKGRTVARVIFDISFPDGVGLFTERIWAEKGHIFQVNMVTIGATASKPEVHENDMDWVMNQILNSHPKTSLWNLLIPKAIAGDDVVDWRPAGGTAVLACEINMTPAQMKACGGLPAEHRDGILADESDDVVDLENFRSATSRATAQFVEWVRAGEDPEGTTLRYILSLAPDFCGKSASSQSKIYCDIFKSK